MKLPTGLIATVLLCSTLGAIQGCVYDGHRHHGDRRGNRHGQNYESERANYCAGAPRHDDSRYDCDDYDRRYDEHDRR